MHKDIRYRRANAVHTIRYCSTMYDVIYYIRHTVCRYDVREIIIRIKYTYRCMYISNTSIYMRVTVATIFVFVRLIHYYYYQNHHYSLIYN